MIKLEKIKLVNYCGYKNFELSMADGSEMKKWGILYGPNGIGKSNLIRAIELLSSPRVMRGRLDNKLFLRRLTYHPNYQPHLIGFDKSKTDLYMEAAFNTGDGQKRTVLENNWKDRVGLTTDEVPLDIISYSSYIDADNPNNLYSFQINVEDGDKFINMAEAVYGLKCYFPEGSIASEIDSSNNQRVSFYTDFVIVKYGQTFVHYKSFSDGEKKIATLLASLFRKSRESYILLVDNIEMHIYFKRHMALLSKIEEIFPDHQVIATTHSSVIVAEMQQKYLIDLEDYVH